MFRDTIVNVMTYLVPIVRPETTCIIAEPVEEAAVLSIVACPPETVTVIPLPPLSTTHPLVSVSNVPFVTSSGPRIGRLAKYCFVLWSACHAASWKAGGTVLARSRAAEVKERDRESMMSPQHNNVGSSGACI
jgi:hypothetical protein